MSSYRSGSTNLDSETSTKVRLTWLGHATVVIEVGGVKLLTDPLLRTHAGLLRRHQVPPAHTTWQDSDLVLLSHLHHDHAELSSLRLLDGVPIVAAHSSARWLRKHELPAVGMPVGSAKDLRQLPPARWRTVADLYQRARVLGGQVRSASSALDNVHITLTPAVHGHRPMPHRPNAATGHAVRSGSHRIWFAGDTEDYPNLGLLAQHLGGPIDLAVVPVGGWGPRLSGGHMDPVAAAQACGRIGARSAVAVHWGTLHPPIVGGLGSGWSSSGGHTFVSALAKYAPNCRPILLLPGQSRTLYLR